MQKQSLELITGISKDIKTHTLIYDNKSGRVKFFLTLRSRVSKILKENPGISLIHLNDGLMAVFSLPLLKLTNIPILATIHGLDIVMPGRFYQNRIVPKLRRFAGMIAVSSATAKECTDRDFDADKVFVVPNGVDTSLADIPADPGFRKKLEERFGVSLEGKHILVTVGRPVKRKGFSWFLNSVMPLLDDNIVYIVIGPKDEHIKTKKFFLSLLPKSLSFQLSLIFGLSTDETEVMKALEKPELKDRAFFVGKIPFAEMMQTLKAADLFIMPNIKAEGDAEGFGLVALEAAVCGLPVVAAGIEGITDAVIEGKNGWLVPSKDAQAWKEKITQLLSDKKELKAFGKKAQEYTVENFSWKKMCDGYISVFKKISGK